MPGLDDFISSTPFLRDLANTLGMTKTVEQDPELPSFRPKGFSTFEKDTEKNLDTNPLYYIAKSTKPTDLPEGVRAYRADPTNKYGGGTGVETVPIKGFYRDDPGALPFVNMQTALNKINPQANPLPAPLDKYSISELAIKDLYRRARLSGAASKHGMPSLTPEELAAFALKEGRSDYGVNSFRGSPGEKKMENDVFSTYDIHPQDANFLALIASKKAVADRLGRALPEVWNGTGKNVFNQSGKDYAKDWNAHYEAAKHEKNKELMDLIRRAYADGQKYGLPLVKDNEKNILHQRKNVPYKNGGRVEKPLPGGNKLI